MLREEVFLALEGAFINLISSPGANACLLHLDDTLPPYINDYIYRASSLKENKNTWANSWSFTSDQSS